MRNRQRPALADRIVRLLRGEQMHKQALCTALHLDYMSVDSTVTALSRARIIVNLGTAGDAGYTDVRTSAPVYGLPGQKLKRVAAKAKPAHIGSGVIPEPCREREWKPLCRDPFVHMRLAMAVRR